MTARQQWGIVGAIVLALGIGLVAANRFLGAELHEVSIGSRAPNFTAKELGSTRVKSLDDYKGQVVLLNVWATWCPPCQAEIPSIEKLYRKYGPRGLKVVAVSIDDAVTEDSIRAFARDFGMSFDVLHDPQGRIEEIYQTTGYPETFVIGKDGVIRKKWIGAANWNDPGNQALIAQLLGLAPERLRFESTDSLPPGWTPGDSGPSRSASLP